MQFRVSTLSLAEVIDIFDPFGFEKDPVHLHYSLADMRSLYSTYTTYEGI